MVAILLDRQEGWRKQVRRKQVTPRSVRSPGTPFRQNVGLAEFLAA
jgi:hypothetical protein